MKNFNLNKIRACLSSNRVTQFGGGLLPVVATVGVVMVMTQGTIYYKAKTSSKFLTTEKNKMLAQQVAEAGIENGISDLGSRRLIIADGMREQITAQNVSVGNGTFTTRLTTVGRGPQSDTVDFNSIGQVSANAKAVSARLKLTNVVDTSRVILTSSAPLITSRVVPQTVYTTTTTTTVQNPNTMPILNTTAAYTACMNGAPNKCNVCHIPGGNVGNRHVINIAKAAINTHVSHHGDYVTTDGTCDIYQPQTVSVVTSSIVFQTVYDTTVVITYDTNTVIDTLTRIKVLSWR